MRLQIILTLILQTTLATDRVVVTFNTWELAAMPYGVVNATIVKQYGRRMVLDLGREAELPEAWLWELFGTNVTVELDALVMVNQIDPDDFWDEDETTPEEPETTVTEVTTTAMLATTPQANAAQSFNFNLSPVSNTPWNMADAEPYSIHVESTWKTTNSTPDIFVAVLDTGLAQVARGAFLNLQQGYDFISDELISLDDSGRDGDPTDPGDSGPDCVNPSWHGTKVMSIMAAAHRNAFGVLGVAQNASIIPIRVLGQCSMGYANDITDAIVWAAGGSINGVPKNPNPAKIISMSFAGSGPCPSYLQSAVNQAAGLGAFLVTAAGNGGLESINNTFPANCENVLSVGAITRNGKLAAYSNRGADIAAPGGDGTDPIHVLTVRNGNLSDSYSMGTSMAVPHVAGVAALHIQRDANFSRWTFLKRHSSALNDSSKMPFVRSTATCDPGFHARWLEYDICHACPAGTYMPFSGSLMPIYVPVPGLGEFTFYSNGNPYPIFVNGYYYLKYCKDVYSQFGWFMVTDSTRCSGQLLSTNLAAYVTTSLYCYRSPVGTYVPSTGASAYQSCAPGTYTDKEQTVNCNLCSSGKFTASSGLTLCTVCAPGTMNTAASSSGCMGCVTGTYNNASGLTLCTACATGKFAAVTGLTVCAMCAVGKYASAVGLSTCADCIPGSTYTLSKQSTACLSCTVCDSLSKYPYSACTTTSDTVCCNSLVGVGTYANSCNGTASCPLLKNGTYINSNTVKLNRCMDFTCNADYYAPPTELAKADTLCQSPKYILNASCAPYMSKVCVPVTKCRSGITTVLSTTSGVAILNSNTNDVQCTKCVPCMPGTVQISPCTDLTQTVCAVCATSGTYAAFPWSGRCMYYSTTPGTMTLSQTPIGYFPYILSYSPDVIAAIANNSISYPTKKVDSFTLDPLTYSMTVTLLTAASTISLNVFIPCAAPPLGRRFKEWSTFQAKVAVACTSITSCSNFQAPCDLASSTECTGWNYTLKKGWYASAPGECSVCPNSSSFSTCNWGFYRNLSDCRPDRVAECFPCHGTLPPNAVWTTSKSPHYFDDSEPNPCNWDCDKGFYKNGTTCTACIKPENSVFDYGPFIAYGNTNPPPKTCLNPETCRYFGGISGFGCAWRCPNGYSLFTGNSVQKCIPCPTISCKADEIVVFVVTCNQCQKCTNIVANAVYQPGCTFTCAQGYYLSSPTYCAPCSVKTCPAGQYSGDCGDTFDSTCIPCTQCAVGYSVSTPCSATADAVCSACTADPVDFSTYDSNCNVVCKAGYVMSADRRCQLCAVSDANCVVGQRKTTTCTALNLGCEACVAPTTYNWCWSAGAVCLWDCGPGYRKLNGACVADASKTTNPCLSDVFVSPVATSLPPVTTPVISPPTSKLVPPDTSSTLFTSLSVTTPKITSLTTPKATTPRATTRKTTTPMATTPPPVDPIITTPVTRETLTVANLPISQCLCSSSQVAAELSALYGTTVFVVSCATDSSTVECTDFVCPCTGNRRRLLQADVTRYTLVYKRAVELVKPATSAINEAIQAVVPEAVVTAVVYEVLGTTTLDWTSVSKTDITGAIVAGVLFVLFVAGIVIVIATRKQPPPVEVRVIRQTIDPPKPDP